MTWAFKADFSNVQPAGVFRRMNEEGYYKVLIRESEETTTRAGAVRALFRLSVAEGEHAGATETFGINILTGDDDPTWVGRVWVALLMSIGVSQDKLAKGEINLTADAFKNKTAYVYFVPRADENSYPSFKWVTKKDYEFYTKTAEPVQAAPEPAPAPAPTPAPAPAPVAAPPAAQQDSGDPLSFLEI